MSSSRRWRLALLSGYSIAMVSHARADAAGDPALRGELEQVARRSIFFGHQSVGRNLLDGLRRLAAAEGVPLHLVETKGSAADVAAGTFAHAAVPENGDPLRKLRSFEQALAGDDRVELAFVKFCYVDIDASTDVAALFARYQATLASLKERHPRTTFVHVTAPLTTLQGGVKGTVKRLLGKPPGGAAENARREQYNALLRKAFEGREPLFDLARVESTRPDGSAETFAWEGRQVPALVPAYSDDGGHLNAEGRTRAARQLVSVLAAAPAAGASAAR